MHLMDPRLCSHEWLPRDLEQDVKLTVEGGVAVIKLDRYVFSALSAHPSMSSTSPPSPRPDQTTHPSTAPTVATPSRSPWPSRCCASATSSPPPPWGRSGPASSLENPRRSPRGGTSRLSVGSCVACMCAWVMGAVVRIKSCPSILSTHCVYAVDTTQDSKLHVTLAQRDRYMKLALDSVLAVGRLPVPTIAAVAGSAFGWGVELALACDLRIAAKDATLCLPETSLGIFPGAAGCVLLRQVVSPSTAKELIFTARRFSGQEAKELGVVTAASDNPWADALALAKRIAANAPLGVRGAKEVIDGSHNVDFSTAVALSSQLRAPLSETDDFREALQAFEEKRKPVFKGQ